MMSISERTDEVGGTARYDRGARGCHLLVDHLWRCHDHRRRRRRPPVFRRGLVGLLTASGRGSSARRRATSKRSGRCSSSPGRAHGPVVPDGDGFGPRQDHRRTPRRRGGRRHPLLDEASVARALHAGAGGYLGSTRASTSSPWGDSSRALWIGRGVEQPRSPRGQAVSNSIAGWPRPAELRGRRTTTPGLAKPTIARPPRAVDKTVANVSAILSKLRDRSRRMPRGSSAPTCRLSLGTRRSSGCRTAAHRDRDAATPAGS